MLSLHFVSRFVGNVLGNLYPAYASYKAVVDKNHQANKHLLMYWIVNTCFTLFELFGDALVSWLPLYYEAKIAFIVWLTLPQFRGAKIVYKHVVAPYMDKYEQDIDNLVESTKTRADSAFKHMRHHSAQIIAAQSSRLLKMGSQLIASAAAEAGRPAPAAGPGGAGVPGTVEEEKKEQ